MKTNIEILVTNSLFVQLSGKSKYTIHRNQNTEKNKKGNDSELHQRDSDLNIPRHIKRTCKVQIHKLLKEDMLVQF